MDLVPDSLNNKINDYTKRGIETEIVAIQD